VQAASLYFWWASGKDRPLRSLPLIPKIIFLQIVCLPAWAEMPALADKIQPPWYLHLLKGGQGEGESAALSCDALREEFPLKESQGVLLVRLRQSVKQWELRQLDFAGNLGCAKAFRNSKFIVFSSQKPMTSDAARKELEEYRKEMLENWEKVNGEIAGLNARTRSRAVGPIGDSKACDKSFTDQVNLTRTSSNEVSQAIRNVDKVADMIWFDKASCIGDCEQNQDAIRKRSLMYRVEQRYGQVKLPAECGAQYQQAYNRLLDQTKDVHNKIDDLKFKYLSPLRDQLTNASKVGLCRLERCGSLK